ncbi:hypothetical protein K2X89_10810 [Myxococcota bacterium]|nr:hypothetical protein [Myxococcota bacterium]
MTKRKYQVVESVRCDARTPAQVDREFRALLDRGMALRVAGAAKRRPKSLLTRGYAPRHRFELFGTRFFVSVVRQNPELRFCVVYVVPPARRGRPPIAYARIFYKDLSLVWRAASHVAYDRDGSIWIGKGDVREFRAGGYTMVESIESTTDLPLEIQTALEDCSRATKKTRADAAILRQVLQQAPPSRVEPFPEFTTPRARAFADPANRIHGGRTIARFRRRGDPGSLEFAKGFEPDFAGGVVETNRTKSNLYHGVLRRYRILSKNRAIQYLFIAGRRHVWIIPPQSLSPELSSFGLRLVDVVADEDLFIPGYEYHYFDEDADPPALYSQIPKGYAGRPCAHDPNKADASPWLEALPVIRKFRRQILA